VREKATATKKLPISATATTTKENQKQQQEKRKTKPKRNKKKKKRTKKIIKKIMTNTELQNTIIEVSKKNKLTKFSERVKKIKAEEIKTKVAFLGEFSSGKSTLINALMKKRLLPTFTEPTTATITEIQKSIENKVIVIEEENGEDTQREINLSELAEEVTKTQTNKKIQIFRKDIDFIDENIQIIDTPGVSSINDTHTDVTYGYLPFIDIAFILVNVESGGANNSLITFLKNYPKEILSKIYFVLTWTDTKSPESLKKIKNNFKNQVAEIIPEPKIFEVSGKDALESAIENDNEKYEKSGINQIINVIKVDIPKLKSEIAEKRITEILQTETKELKKLLEYKLKSISWDTDKFSDKIKNLKNETAEIKIDIKNFNQHFDKIKEKITEKIDEIIEKYSEIIGLKNAKNENSEIVINNMMQEINSEIEFNLKKIKNFKFHSLNNSVTELIRSSVEISSSNAVNTIGNLTTKTLAITGTAFGLLLKATPYLLQAYSTYNTLKNTDDITPPAGNDNTNIDKIKDTSKNNDANKTSKFQIISDVIKDNPKEATGLFSGLSDTIKNNQEEINSFFKDIKVFFIKKKNIKDALKNLSIIINKEIIILFEKLEFSLNELIETQYLQPLHEKEDLLTNLRSEKKEYFSNIENAEKQIKKDISDINMIINKQ